MADPLPLQTSAVDVGPCPEQDEGPLRRCIVSGRRSAPEGMLRFAVGPEGEVGFDVDARLPGRGLWLSPDRAIVEAACAKGSFAKAARAAVRVSPDLPQAVERLMRARCLDLIGLARRAGAATWGFERVRDVVRAGGAVLLLQACDGADGGRAKVRALAPGLPVIEVFTSADLGRALGQEALVHVALAPGGLAERLKVLAARLMAYTTDGAATAPKTDR